MNNLVYVTAFIDVYDDRDDRKVLLTRKEYMDYFLELSKVNANIVCFADRSFEVPSNVNLILCKKEELIAYAVMNRHCTHDLPRNINKDTHDYMILMNSKTEFMKRAMKIIESKHYAWIDFGIFKIFKNNGQDVLKRLSEFSNREFDGLHMPGCLPRQDLDSYLKGISWRFCGGFFVGDKKSIEVFTGLYDDFFEEIMRKYKTWLWEVNVWGILENEYRFFPNVYYADHNESMILSL